jgi:branched-chain amino acid aminotransferase
MSGTLMSFDNTSRVWHNGKIVSWADAAVHLSANVVQYGSGVFEGIRCYETPDGPAVFRLKSHLDRFYASASCYEIEIPYGYSELETAVVETIQRNHFTSCYIRPVCFYGSNQPGVSAVNCPVHVAVLTWPWAPLLGAESQKSGVRVTVSKWVKTHFSMLPSTAKACGGYLNSMLAVREARHRGFEEALLLNQEGTVAEGPTENVFIVNDQVLITNDENSSILLGITRDSVIQIAHDLGYTVQVRAFQLAELLSATEAFFSGTATEIVPIRQVDETMIGSGRIGPITDKIQQVFLGATSGNDVRYRKWLRYLIADKTIQARGQATTP